MAYRRYQRYSKPTPRNIEVKYAGECACCSTIIKAGEIATYYPVGTIDGCVKPQIAHIGGLDGNSVRCAGNLRKIVVEDTQVANYVAEGLGEW